MKFSLQADGWKIRCGKGSIGESKDKRQECLHMITAVLPSEFAHLFLRAKVLLWQSYCSKSKHFQGWMHYEASDWILWKREWRGIMGENIDILKGRAKEYITFPKLVDLNISSFLSAIWPHTDWLFNHALLKLISYNEWWSVINGKRMLTNT